MSACKTIPSGDSKDRWSENVYVWEMRTGSVLATFKNNSSDVNCFTPIGSQLFATALSDSATLHFWSWKKVKYL